MYLISAEGYKNANVEFLTIKSTSEIWVNMKDVGSGMGVKNISMWFSFKRNIWYWWKKNPIKKQVNEYKITKRQIYKRFNNLSEKELTTKNNKKTYVRNEKNKLMKKNRLTETIFKEKRQKALEKKTWL